VSTSTSSPLLDDLPEIAGHLNVLAHLPGPLATGAVDRKLPLDASGRARTGTATRHPVLVVAPRTDLGGDGLAIEVSTTEGAALPGLWFAPHTPAGAGVVALVPAVDQTGSSPAVGIRLAATWKPTDGAHVAVAVGDLADLVVVRVIEGVLGKLLFVMGRGHAEVRTTSRSILAARRLDGATGAALDRTGEDLAVPRLGERLVAGDGIITTEPGRESDADYRARLAIYRPLLQPTHRQVERLLNGPGGPADVNAGLPAAVGVRDRFRVVEADDPFAVGVLLVETGEGGLMRRWLQGAAAVHLAGVGGTEPAARFLPDELRRERNAMRRRLRERFATDGPVTLAPPLARALDLLTRCRAALGVEEPLQHLAPAAGAPPSRYQLSLGIDVRLPTVAVLDQLVEAAQSPPRSAGRDPEVAAILADLAPVARAADPTGAWLLRACGLRTVHPVAPTRLYLSHLPTGGLRIDRVDDGGRQIRLRAQVGAPGDEQSHAALERAVSGAVAALAGEVALRRSEDPAAVWAAARTPTAATNEVLRAVPLPVADTTTVAARLGRIAPALHATLTLDEATSADVVAGRVRAIAMLRRIVDELVERRIVSILPVVTTDGRVHLVAGVVGLPWAGINGHEHRVAGFRWSVVPLVGVAATITPTGSEAEMSGNGHGLWAVVVHAAVRGELTDPYEMRVELPTGATLRPDQYEFVLNLLDHAHPAGVEVNTFRLRRRHVDLSGNGEPDPLDPTLARSYRPFRRPR
jgi:hypothetical protein